MTKFTFLAIGIILVGIIYFLTNYSRQEQPLKTVVIGQGRWQVEVADTMLKRARGLSGRQSLAEDRGMLFLFNKEGNHGFWMKDMNFAIDIIWIKGDRVVGFQENATPESYQNFEIFYPPEPVDKVLEVNAGSVAKYGLEEGSVVGEQDAN